VPSNRLAHDISSHNRKGSVFEKRIIEAYIAEHGKDPVNGEELSTEDLIDVKSQRIVRPRPPTLTSIPSLLSVFQEEWDALALETYTLQQNLAQTRRELSSALYQHDAAVRVIARLTQERDEAREALSNVSVGATRSGGDAMQVDSTGLPQEVLERIENTQASYVAFVSLFKNWALTNWQTLQDPTQARNSRGLGLKRGHFYIPTH
jgi:pre-mRNA-processing factor 19